MARKLRKNRVAAAALIVLVLIGGICFLSFKACGRDKGNGGANNTTAATGTSGAAGGATAANQGAVWPVELSSYVKEYNGAGSLVLAESTRSDDGKTLYRIRYKGTTINSCFSYAKDSLGISGEWTEVVTDEHYTLSRETDQYVLDLSCEPKAENGYDFQISVKIK